MLRAGDGCHSQRVMWGEASQASIGGVPGLARVNHEI